MISATTTVVYYHAQMAVAVDTVNPSAADSQKWHLLKRQELRLTLAGNKSFRKSMAELQFALYHALSIPMKSLHKILELEFPSFVYDWLL